MIGIGLSPQKISLRVRNLPSPPVNTSAPVVSPDPLSEGDTATCSTGTWSKSPTSFTYQWQSFSSRGGTWADILGGTSSSVLLTVSPASFNKIRCLVTATNANGSTEAYSQEVNYTF